MINPDPRGVHQSEGAIVQWGTQEGQDAADLIEWVAAQEWCNGKVGMSGHSWLAIAQWFAAAERPAHLAAIAPWEGCSDGYRDSRAPGGIPEIGMAESVLQTALYGEGLVEDLAAMIESHPLFDDLPGRVSGWHVRAAAR